MVLNKQMAIKNRVVEPRYIGTEEVMMMYSVSRTTARKLGEQAGAIVKFGRRTFYNVELLEKYFDNLPKVKA